MKPALCSESLSHNGGDDIQRRRSSRLWYRQTDATTEDDLVLSGRYRSRSTSLLAPEVVASVEWSNGQESSRRTL